MTYQFQIVSPQEYADWYEDVGEEASGGSPFHHPAWLIAATTAVRSQQMPIQIFEDGEEIGMIPGFAAGRGPVKVWGSPLKGMMTSYLGPVGTGIPEDEEDLLDLTRSASAFLRRRHGYIYTRAALRNSPSEEKPDFGPTWEHQRPKSYRLDLTEGEEAVWDNLTSDCRRNIRKARKQDVEVSPFDDPDVFFRMLDETLRRHGATSPHPPRFFHALFDELGPLLKPRAAMYQGRIIAAGLFLSDGRELHYLSGASDPAFGSFPTSYALHWSAISNAISQGVEVFNSDASRIRSIDRFKESFRPDLERRHTIIGSSPLVYWAQKKMISGYRTYQKARARVTSAG